MKNTNEMIHVLKAYTKMLDCTYAPEWLITELNMNKDLKKCFDPSIVIENGVPMLRIEAYEPYEESEYYFIGIDKAKELLEIYENEAFSKINSV